MLVLHGFHPSEEYARNIALSLETLGLDRVVVKESPRPKRDFTKLMRMHKAKWVLDLHSESPETIARTRAYVEEDKRSAYLGTIGWWRGHDYNEIIERFFDECYGGRTVLTYGPGGPHRGRSGWGRRAGTLTLGLLWYRPFEQSVDLLKKLTDYLKRTSP